MKVATEHRVRNSPGTNNLIAEMLRFLGSAVRLHSTWRRQICNLFRTSGVWGGGGKSRTEPMSMKPFFNIPAVLLLGLGMGMVSLSARAEPLAPSIASQAALPGLPVVSTPANVVDAYYYRHHHYWHHRYYWRHHYWHRHYYHRWHYYRPYWRRHYWYHRHYHYWHHPYWVPPPLLAPPLLLPAPLLVLSRRAGHPVFGRGETIVASPCFA